MAQKRTLNNCWLSRRPKGPEFTPGEIALMREEAKNKFKSSQISNMRRKLNEAVERELRRRILQASIENTIVNIKDTNLRQKLRTVLFEKAGINCNIDETIRANHQNLIFWLGREELAFDFEDDLRSRFRSGIKQIQVVE